MGRRAVQHETEGAVLRDRVAVLRGVRAALCDAGRGAGAGDAHQQRAHVKGCAYKLGQDVTRLLQPAPGDRGLAVVNFKCGAYRKERRVDRD